MCKITIISNRQIFRHGSWVKPHQAAPRQRTYSEIPLARGAKHPGCQILVQELAFRVAEKTARTWPCADLFCCLFHRCCSSFAMSEPLVQASKLQENQRQIKPIAANRPIAKSLRGKGG